MIRISAVRRVETRPNPPPMRTLLFRSARARSRDALPRSLKACSASWATCPRSISQTPCSASSRAWRSRASASRAACAAASAALRASSALRSRSASSPLGVGRQTLSEGVADLLKPSGGLSVAIVDRLDLVTDGKHLGVAFSLHRFEGGFRPVDKQLGGAGVVVGFDDRMILHPVG